MGEKIFHVDAFTDAPFAGNPAAVCLLEREPGDAWLQGVAREMNLSETAFLRRGAESWALRWFTPAMEVDLCGHATLASAHVLWEAGYAEPGATLRFETKSGRLEARPAKGKPGVIELDFPAEPPAPADAPPGLLEALGLGSARTVGRNRFDYLVEVADEEAVRALRPDFRRLAEASGVARGVIVTARGSGSSGWDFVSRFFAPSAGIDEDPVTGSAHCALGPFWAERLGRSDLTGRQLSARGGTVGVRVEGARLVLSGRAVTIARGELEAAGTPAPRIAAV